MPEARLVLDGGERGSLEAEKAALEFSARGDRLHVELEAKRGALVLAGRRKPLTTVAFAGAIDPRELAIDRLEVAGAGLELTAREGRFARPLGGAGAAQLEMTPSSTTSRPCSPAHPRPLSLAACRVRAASRSPRVHRC